MSSAIMKRWRPIRRPTICRIYFPPCEAPARRLRLCIVSKYRDVRLLRADDDPACRHGAGPGDPARRRHPAARLCGRPFSECHRLRRHGASPAQIDGLEVVTPVNGQVCNQKRNAELGALAGRTANCRRFTKRSPISSRSSTVWSSIGPASCIARKWRGSMRCRTIRAPAA